MKLLTLNCHSWLEENQEEKLKHIAKVIVENQYDVVALQEVNQLIESKVSFKNVKEDNFALVLLEEIRALGNNEYSFIWDYSHIGFDKFEEGIAILTKYPIVEEESFFISKGKDQSFWKTRKILKCKIDYNGKNLNIYSCHLGWWKDDEEPFEYQCDKLIENIKQDELAIVMGDFNNNAFVSNEGYDYLLAKGLYDSYNLSERKDSGITIKGEIDGWDKNSNDLRIDLILTNRSIEVEYSRVIFNGENKEIVSDHYGVEVFCNLLL